MSEPRTGRPKPPSNISPSISVETAKEIFAELQRLRNDSLKKAATARMKKLAGIKENWASKKINKYKRDVDSIRKKAIDAEAVYDAWMNAGQPTRIDELIHFLQAVGFSDREIGKAMKNVGVEERGEMESIKGLAQAIKGTNLTPHVLKYLGANVEQDPNDIAINNREIRLAFEKIADLIPQQTAEESVEYDNNMYGRKRKS